PKLDRALDGLWMAFQPIVEFSQKKPLAYEALMRTNAPDVKGPGEMLALAESTGRTHELGRRVRQQVAGVLDSFTPDADVFVNLHPADLDDTELYSVSAPLSRHAKKVVLEITERASVNDDAQLTERMMALRGLGYRIAVDDLGAGYSGLTTLARVQPEFVKIDGSLVRNIDTSSVNQLIVTAVCDLSRELNVRVVAECIETPRELATLRALGVDLLQGYYFARPTPQFAAIDPVKFESQPAGQ
ncbi:MAG: EAL domain-containing protein, partial [Archangium sp.]